MYKNFKEFLIEHASYLSEARKSSSSGGKYKPKDRDELKALVRDNSIHLGDIDISNVDNLKSVFSGSNRKDFSGIENWDVSHVTKMNHMFEDCENFNQPLDKWDVKAVKDMHWMFNGAKSFDQDLSVWGKNIEKI